MSASGLSGSQRIFGKEQASGKSQFLTSSWFVGQPQYVTTQAPQYVTTQAPQYVTSQAPQYVTSQAPHYVTSRASQYVTSRAPQYFTSQPEQVSYLTGVVIDSYEKGERNLVSERVIGSQLTNDGTIVNIRKTRQVPVMQVEERIVEVPKIEIQTVERIVEIPQIQYVDKIVEVPQIQEVTKEVIKIQTQEQIREVPRTVIQTVEKVVEVPQVQTVERVVQVPQIQEVVRQVPRVEIQDVQVQREVQIPRLVVETVEQGLWRQWSRSGRFLCLRSWMCRWR
uniref:Uncharacterized protein n=1 Tax=Oxyrrhis marina TaxID=2969 RepID=A0A7S4LPE9_OXYMA